MMAKPPGDPYIAKIIAMGFLQISPGGPNDKGRYTVDVIVDDDEMLGMVWRIQNHQRPSGHTWTRFSLFNIYRVCQ